MTTNCLRHLVITDIRVQVFPVCVYSMHTINLDLYRHCVYVVATGIHPIELICQVECLQLAHADSYAKHCHQNFSSGLTTLTSEILCI